MKKIFKEELKEGMFYLLEREGCVEGRVYLDYYKATLEGGEPAKVVGATFKKGLLESLSVYTADSDTGTELSSPISVRGKIFIEDDSESGFYILEIA